MMMIGVVALGLMWGCQGGGDSDWDMQKPSAPVEMNQLKLFAGTWEGTAEIVSPTREQIEKWGGGKMLEQMPETLRGGGVTKFELNGMFLMSDGWHDMTKDTRARYVEYVTWDPKWRRFKSWYFSDMGEYGTGCWIPSKDGRSFKIRGKGRKADGSRMSASGTMHLPDDDTIEWTWKEGGLFTSMKLKGTSHRVK